MRGGFRATKTRCCVFPKSFLSLQKKLSVFWDEIKHHHAAVVQKRLSKELRFSPSISFTLTLHIELCSTFSCSTLFTVFVASPSPSLFLARCSRLALQFISTAYSASFICDLIHTFASFVVMGRKEKLDFPHVCSLTFLGRGQSDRQEKSVSNQFQMLWKETAKI